MLPHVVVCAGLYASGSTWCLNATRQLLEIASGATTEIVSVYSDIINDRQDRLIADSQCVVLKTHNPDPGMRCMAREGGLPTFVTIRDPRDAVVSMMQRFAMPFDRAISSVTESAKQLESWLELVPSTILRYEDGFMSSPETVGTLARALHLRVPVRRRQAIFSALRAEVVSAIVSAQFGNVPAAQAEAIFDPVTQWHPRHVGDGRIGKYADVLSPDEVARVEKMNRRFMRKRGYGPVAERGLRSGTVLTFEQGSEGSEYLEEGFRSPESWGVWMNTTSSKITVPLAVPARSSVLLTFDVHCSAELMQARAEGTSVAISINGVTATLVSAVAPVDHGGPYLSRTIECGLDTTIESLDIRLWLAGPDGDPIASRSDRETLVVGLMRVVCTYQ